MIAVLQRVSEASVTIDGEVKSAIQRGLLVLLGIEDADNEDDIEWLTKKIVNMRIFNDDEGKMNKSLADVGGQLLVVSQFTLHASTKKGNRPSYIKAANPQHAVPMYNKFIQKISQFGCPVKTGEFGAYMEVHLINDGPVTIIVDTKNKQ